MSDYDSSAPFYDAVMGDRAEAADYVRSLIEKHGRERGACSSSRAARAVLERLEPNYDVTGVDLSADMLEVAAKKLPQARLVQGDMTDVSLGVTFDVVLCVFDSINHLLTFGRGRRSSTARASI